ncbi:nucleotidyltransferase domain-containing protein [Aquimarina sp. U1-2]|uniref:nucleotidyltransferase domain-containing protein n=1 Tax=Aquimarina sp. U1-2 TaxID=2823141 RepID=UPI001AECC9B8|nr:nucleotidyltransferase domain-containing protein [Aquimarina sp. U1-2]MBP2831299.1 nucleotidyltransferase domain-containing protein [Aquimarina sp. U1-2]
MSYLTEIERKNIINFLLKKYPMVLTAILSGSVIDETADINSDIDIIIIVSNRNQLHNETLSFKGYKLQTFIIPLQHLYERFYADYSSARGHFIGLIAKGVYLFGDLKLANSITDHSVELKNNGPKPMSNEDHLDARISITKCAHKLDNIKEKWENLILDAGKLVDNLIGFKLHSEGVWKGDGKHRMKFLEEHNPQFKQEIISALDLAYVKKDYKKLVEIAEKELIGKGGLVELYPVNNIQLALNEGSLCIHIPFLDNFEQRLNTLQILSQSLLKFKNRVDQNFTNYFYTTYSTGQGFSPQDIFCVIHAKHEWLNNFLIDWLYALKNDHDLNNMHFPAFIGFKFRFVTEPLYKAVIPIFNKLNSFVIEGSDEFFDQSFQISSAFAVVSDLNHVYFHGKGAAFKEFLFFMFKNYFVYSYDCNERINSKELMRRRNDTLLQFEETYQLQKDILIRLWTEDFDSIIEKEIKGLISSLPDLESELASFPDYNSYFFRGIQNSTVKEIVFLKEFLIRCLEILLIDPSFIPYIFYAALRLGKVTYTSIEQELALH